MVGYGFQYNKSPKGEPIFYKVGNPMGFYTSWALTTLCHHLVLYTCCEKLKINFKTARYKLLGDDIVIFDDKLAFEYKALMTKLGVEINLTKSFVSKTYFEFAKRIFIPCGEISPFPIGSVNDSIKCIFNFIEMYNSALMKGFIFKSKLTCAKAFYNMFFRGNTKYYRRLHKNIERGFMLNNIFNKFTTPRELINDILNEINNSASEQMKLNLLSCNQEEMSKDIFSSMIMLTFTNAHAKLENVPDDIVFNMIMRFSADDPEASVAYAHPYVTLTGILHENEYIKLMSDALYFDTKLKGQ